MSRNGSFYVATCAQLYEVVDDISKMEFGEGLATLTPDRLSARTGQSLAVTAGFLKELMELMKTYAFATSGKRFLYPPVFSWKRKTRS